MLGVKNIKSVRYYAELAHQDDYYHKGKEPSGKWHGQGCEEYKLNGEVQKQDFYALCAGKNPHDQTEKLVKNAGKQGELGRRPGWDLTFSAPKSVSTLWASSDEMTRQAISRIQEDAVKKTLDYYEENYGRTRVGKTGTETEQSKKLFFALFEHSTSRALDPQLHTHAVMVNLGINPHGQTKSLQTLDLYRVKMELGAFYRAELGQSLKKELGCDIVAGNKGTFEIKGVPKDLMDTWSTRRAEIVTELNRLGLSGAKASEIATLNTRTNKEYPDRDLLFIAWRKTALEQDFFYGKVLYETRPYPKDEVQKAEFMGYLVEGFTAQRAYFSEGDLKRAVLEKAPVFGVSAKEAVEMAKGWIQTEGVKLGDRKGTLYYTTKEIDQMEKSMLEEVKAGQQYQPRLRESKVTLREDLSKEQREAALYITETKGQFKVVSGMAGAGKTTMLQDSKRVWEAQGYEVKGVSLSAVAAKNLENEAGIKSETIAKFLWTLNKEKVPGARDALNHKTVLVIDEAGMVGTRQMVEIVKEARKTGAKVVMVGDEKQLQPIEHGAPFKAIGEALGKAELKEIRRQRELWAKDAVMEFADGEAEKALKRYAEKGYLHIKEDRAAAVKEVVAEWWRDQHQPAEKLMLGTTNADVEQLNQFAQKVRAMAGELGKVGVEVNGSTIFENDRVVFTRNQKSLGLINGEGGEVREIDIRKNRMTVKLDSGDLRTVPLDRYKDVSLGYAVTTHKAQGKTVENAYVMTGMMQDRELSYVQASRARGVTRIFTTYDQMDAGELAKMMSRSNQKELAQAMREQSEREGRTAEHSIERGQSR